MSIKSPRVKQVRQVNVKNGSQNSYKSAIPIGTDGLLVDMLSQLDLEEELRIGGNHYTTIDESETVDSETKEVTYTTIITELYYDRKTPENTTYTVQILIIETGSLTTITMELYKGKKDDNKLLHSKTITITEQTREQHLITDIVEKLDPVTEGGSG